MSGGRSESRINWWGLLLLPLAVPVALVAGLFAKPARRTPHEVARYLREFIDGRGCERDWDEFESVPIADPTLEQIRREAAMAGPPNADMTKLGELLVRAEKISDNAPTGQASARGLG